MNRTWVTAVILAAVATTPAVALCDDQSAPPPVIIVDAGHNHFYVPAGHENPFYQVPPAATLAVDASGYEIPIPSPLRDRITCPNAIQFGSGRGKYSSAWPTQGNRIVLGPDNLVPLVDSGPFAGLIAGDTCVIGIGHQERIGDTVQFFPFWVGMIEVIDASQADVSLASLPPSVVSTVPRGGDTDVSPGLTEVSVTFSKDMKVTGHCWSWCGVRDDSFPKCTAPTRFLDDKRTCVMTVALQPEKTYAIWINTEEYHSFQDPDGHTAVPYLLVFRTVAE